MLQRLIVMQLSASWPGPPPIRLVTTASNRFDTGLNFTSVVSRSPARIFVACFWKVVQSGSDQY